MSKEDNFVTQVTQLLSEQADEAERGLDYSRADAKTLVTEYLPAREELSSFPVRVHEAIEVYRQQEPADLMTVVETLADVCARFPSVAATVRATWRVIKERSSQDAVNWHFGVFKLAHMVKDEAARDRAFREIQGLAEGIAKNKGLFPPDRQIRWQAATDSALEYQLRYYGNLDVAATLERMVENKFAAIANAIYQKQCKEVGKEYDKPVQVPLTKAKNVAAPEAGEREEELGRSFLLELEAEPGTRSKQEQGVLEAIANLLDDPDLRDMTKAEVLEEVGKHAAAIRRKTPRTGLTDRKAILADAAAKAEVIRALRKMLADRAKANRLKEQDLPVEPPEPGDPTTD